VRPVAAGRAGFTLIEVLVVMAILAVLASIVVSRHGNTVVRADATELRTRINSTELALDQYQVLSGVLPNTGTSLGVVPPELGQWVQADLFDAPYGVSIQYLEMSGRAFGMSGQIPVLLMVAQTARAWEVLEALKQLSPRAVRLVLPRVAVYPLAQAGAPAGPAPSERSGGDGTEPPGTSESGSGGDQRSPPGSSESSAGPTEGPASGSSGGPSAGAGGGSPSSPHTEPPSPQYPPDTPSACFTGRLPPGQQKQCERGNTNSAWFRGQHGG
jgi:prepilin-type N-terminal cleavage/methylation domain-containing protein